MADTREQWAFPFQVGSDGYVVTVEQESDEEVEGCMAVVLLWPLGTRELNPDFGIDEQNFLTGGANLDEIREALETNEPRALESITQDDSQLVNFISSIRVGWDRSTSGAEQ